MHVRFTRPELKEHWQEIREQADAYVLGYVPIEDLAGYITHGPDNEIAGETKNHKIARKYPKA